MTAPDDTQAMKQKPLADLMWEYRPLLLFTPDNSHPDFVEQSKRVKQTMAKFEEREMALILIRGGGEPALRVILDDDGTPLKEQINTTPATLYQFYDVQPDKFAGILVGKDGTVKAQWHEPFAMEAVYGLIDTMPMRQREMQEQQ